MKQSSIAKIKGSSPVQSAKKPGTNAGLFSFLERGCDYSDFDDLRG